MYEAQVWTNEAVNIILGVIMIARLYAMYQRSKKVLIFLIVIFIATRIANTVMITIIPKQLITEEFILSGTYQCVIGYPRNVLPLLSMSWIPGAVWEVLALCLAVWVAVKRFRELRRHSTRSVIRDCFVMLVQTHVIYFA
ncbi:hypothetical protein BD769DRAFT_1776621, partial [Suillus cothurnatus]